MVITALLVAMSGIDFDTQLLPDALTLPLLWMGLLAAVVLGFVWSPFLAMLVRLSHVNPSLAPDAQPAGSPDLAPPLTPGGAPPADGRRSRVPSP